MVFVVCFIYFPILVFGKLIMHRYYIVAVIGIIQE